MQCSKDLKKAIDALPNGPAKSQFLALYNKLYGGVTANSGGGGNNGGDPPK
jgi:hypothetical protein